MMINWMFLLPSYLTSNISAKSYYYFIHWHAMFMRTGLTSHPVLENEMSSLPYVPVYGGIPYMRREASAPILPFLPKSLAPVPEGWKHYISGAFLAI